MLGCEEWRADEKLVQNIWQEVVKIAELDPNTPMPQVVFLKNSERGVNGRCYLQEKRAEIYLGSIYNTIWAQRSVHGRYGAAYGYDISYKEGEALVYDTVGHEMLHYALFLKLVPTNEHHRLMKENGYLLLVISYINDYFDINSGFKSDRNGCQEDITMRSLGLGIEKDAEKAAKLAKK